MVLGEKEPSLRRGPGGSALRRASFAAIVAMAFSGSLVAAPLRAQPGAPVSLISSPDWSLVAWRDGSDICFTWHGEPDRIETAAGCRTQPSRGVSLLVGETGRMIRFAGISAADVAYVAASAKGHVFAVVATRPLPALGVRSRFFFLHFQAQVSLAGLAAVHWTLVALDEHRRPLTRLGV